MRTAILGLGAMGQRMAQRLLNAGFSVDVWNRTRDKAAPLLAAGANWHDTPADSVAQAEVVISMLRDDDASRAVWMAPTTGALHALPPHATVIECSSLSIGWVQELARSVNLHGNVFLDAPVVGSRPQAEGGTLVHLVGGEAAHLDRVRPVLSALSGAVHHVGPVGSGAAMKLLVNMVFGTQVAAVAEALGWAQHQRLDPQVLSTVLGALPVCSPVMKGAVDSMLHRSFDPLFPLDLAEKDLRYFLAEARNRAANTPVAETAHAVMLQGVAEGLADRHLTAVSLLYDRRREQRDHLDT